MADLRELLESLGHSEVSTLGQSGNAVFTSAPSAPDQIAPAIEAAILKRFDMKVSVLLRSAEELQRIVNENPLPEALAEPSRLQVAFLSETPSPERIASLSPADFEPDQFRFGERVIYAWYRTGILESKLPYVWEKHLGVTATSRNWNTVTRLAQVAGGSLPARP